MALSDGEIDRKYLEIMSNIYEEIKVGFANLVSHNDWDNSTTGPTYWDSDRRNEFCEVVIEMLEAVPHDCGPCMVDKLVIISDYCRGVAGIDGLNPMNDRFTKAWDDVFYDTAMKYLN